jgi:hypothetical protein
MRIKQKVVVPLVALVVGFLAVPSLANGDSAAQDTRDADGHRYEPRKPSSLTVPRRPITRKDYVDFVRPWAENVIAVNASKDWNVTADDMQRLRELAGGVGWEFEPRQEMDERLKAIGIRRFRCINVAPVAVQVQDASELWKAPVRYRRWLVSETVSNAYHLFTAGQPLDQRCELQQADEGTLRIVDGALNLEFRLPPSSVSLIEFEVTAQEQREILTDSER